MGRGQFNDQSDALKYAPPRHRLLVNITEKFTEAEARAYLTRTFGPAKAKAAVLVKGCLRSPDKDIMAGPWHKVHYGWLVFLPKDFPCSGTNG